MQFLVTGYDGGDAGAPGRRQAVRDEHLRGAERMYRQGTLLHAAAILDDQERMIGSVMIVEFPSEQALREQWLDTEPYVTGDVWRKLRVQPCRVPGFLGGAR